MIDSDARALLRTLYDALIEARPYVFGRVVPPDTPGSDWRSETASDVLERVDAALAEVGEVLT